MRAFLILVLLAAMAIVGSVQLLPYPPEPKITKDTFMSSKSSAVDWEVIDRTHKSDRGWRTSVPVVAKSTAAEAPASGKKSYWYFSPTPEHCSIVAGCKVI